MQAIISGETPNKKIDVYTGNYINDFLENEKKIFDSFSKKHCLYQNKFSIIDSSLNYLNVIPTKKIDIPLKSLLLKEFNECDKLYPYLGDLFLESFFNNNKSSKNKFFKFNKSYQQKFIDSIDDINVKNIILWLINNISIERNISILENNDENDITLEVLEDFIFNINYDFDFFKKNRGIKIKDYRFLIIDGYIESVGEIHHLLENANTTKEPHVIFCHGISNDVKYNIIRNNAEGRIQVLPVSIDYNENTINFLNDLAVLHNSDVVSSKLGQTISQESRKQLSLGKSITFNNNQLVIKSVVSEDKIRLHRNFLKKRIDEAKLKSDINIEVLEKRLKSFSSKLIKIYIPTNLLRDKKFTRELDYSLRVISSFSDNLSFKKNKFKENYIIPKKFLKIVEDKIESLKFIFENIEIILA